MLWAPTQDPSRILHQSVRTLVYRQPYPPLGKECVVKTPASLRPDPEQRAHYRREFEFLSRVQGPGLPPLIGLFDPDTHPRLVFEYLEGQSLAHRLSLGPIPLEEVITITMEVAKILVHLHGARIIHGSLCPAHVIWDPATSRCCLLDLSHAAPIPGSWRVVGPPPPVALDYISPELSTRLETSVDHRADLYSLGALTWHLLVGKPPFVSEDVLGLIHAHLARPPFAPHLLRGTIPPPISQVVLRLMAKQPADRYQSGEGVLEDLSQLCSEFSRGQVSTFTPGRGDPGRPLILTPLPLGRQGERHQLREKWAHTRAGKVEVVLLSGPPGIGKSTLAEELKAQVYKQEGQFVASRVEPDAQIPYQPILNCLQQILRILLMAPPDESGSLRQDLSLALGDGASYLVGFLPELALLLGSVPSPPSSEGLGETPHLHILVTALLRALPRPPGGLVLFLDDLEALTPGLKMLLEFITSDPELQGVLFLGGVRENEGAPPALVREFQLTLHRQGVSVTRLVIPPLDLAATTEFILKSCEGPAEEHHHPAHILLTKTGGNPLFLRSLLLRVVAEGILYMQGIQWCWDLAALSRLDCHTDLADLLVQELRHLPEGCLYLLRAAAVVGRSFTGMRVAQVVGGHLADVAEGLRPALSGGVITLTSPSWDDALTYQFSHHHLHQAVYSQAGPAFCWPLHLRSMEILGHLEQVGTPATLMEQVHHLHLCADHLSPLQRGEWAPLALRAALRAQASAAAEQALELFELGLRLLDSQRSHPSYLPLLSGAAESALASGQLAKMEHYCGEVIQTTPDLVLSLPAWVTRLRARMAAGRLKEALQIADTFLNLAGRPQPRPTSPVGLVQAFVHTRLLIGRRQPEDLVDLPRATDALAAAAQRIQVLVAPAQVVETPDILPLAILRDVRSVLQEGVTPHGAQCWTGYALLLLHTFGQVGLANRFGDLALTQVEKLHHPAARPSIFFITYALLRPWSTPEAELVAPLLGNYRQALEVGDLAYGLLSVYMADIYAYVAGLPLHTLWPQVQQTQVILRRHNHPPIEALHQSLVEAIFLLRTDHTPLGPLSHPVPSTHDHPWGRLNAATLRLQQALIFGDLQLALDLALEHHPPLETPIRPATVFSYWTYRAVALLVGVERRWIKRQEVKEGVQQARRMLKVWATHVPARAYTLAWIDAADHRSRGQTPKVMECYERALAEATRGGYQHDVALMADQAAQFLEQQGAADEARRFRRRAIAEYHRWGAKARARQLEVQLSEWVPASPPAEGDTPSLDLLAVVKVSQTLSQEVNATRLLRRLMTALLEASGATRVVLVQREAGITRVTAHQTAGETSPEWGPYPLDTSTDIPVHLIRLVLRTGEMLQLEDSSQGSGDPYLSTVPSRSLVCLPLVRGGEIRGVLYLENHLTLGCFNPTRLETVQLLASQAAISLENAALYSQLEVRIQQRTHEVEEARERAELANQAKSQFLSHMSHELRTPLHAVLGTTHQLLDRPGTDPDLLEGLGTIHRSARHLLELINHVLDMAQIEAGRLELHPSPCDIGKLMDEVMELMEPLALKRGLTLRLDCPTPPPEIEVDKLRLRQVLVNLVGNALKFTREGSVTLRMTSQPSGDHRVLMAFEIEDTGPGIPPDRLEVIFRPFEQSGNTFTRGSGLGLTISQELVRRMGGHIEVSSQVGVGSIFRFSITVPLVSQGETPGESPAPAAGPGLTQGEEPAYPSGMSITQHRPLLEELIGMARLGNMTRFRESLTRLRDLGAEFGPLTERLSYLAGEFDDVGILTMLERVVMGPPGGVLPSPPDTRFDSQPTLDLTDRD